MYRFVVNQPVEWSTLVRHPLDNSDISSLVHHIQTFIMYEYWLVPYIYRYIYIQNSKEKSELIVHYVVCTFFCFSVVVVVSIHSSASRTKIFDSFFFYSSLNVLRLALDQDLLSCSVSGRRSVAMVSKLLNSISSIWRAYGR